MTSPLKNIPRRTLSIQLTEFCPSRIMASEIFSSVYKLPIMPKCRDQILQSNFSRVQVNGPGPPALGRKGRRFTINNGRKQMRTGKSAFLSTFLKMLICLSVHLLKFGDQFCSPTISSPKHWVHYPSL